MASVGMWGYLDLRRYSNFALPLVCQLLRREWRVSFYLVRVCRVASRRASLVIISDLFGVEIRIYLHIMHSTCTAGGA